jgi:hypothetical protein
MLRRLRNAHVAVTTGDGDERGDGRGGRRNLGQRNPPVRAGEGGGFPTRGGCVGEDETGTLGGRANSVVGRRDDGTARAVEPDVTHRSGIELPLGRGKTRQPLCQLGPPLVFLR